MRRNLVSVPFPLWPLMGPSPIVARVAASTKAFSGRLVSANEQLAQLVDLNALEVSFRVSTQQYARLLDGDGRLRPRVVAARRRLQQHA